jgi:carbonic anhydrase
MMGWPSRTRLAYDGRMRRVRTLSCPLLVILIATAIFGVSCTSSPPEPEPTRIVDEEARDRMPEDGHQALKWLLEGNRRFAEGRPRHDFESQRRRMMLTEGQHPFGVILGCSDSRVPPELIFDFGLGDLFVIRVAGNVVADDEAASIEYAIVHLDVRLVLVVGHEGCGAVTAALGATEGEAKELQGLLKQIHPAVADIDPDLPDDSRVHLGVEANVRQSVRKLLEIAERESLPDDERALVVGAVYELDTGLVRVLDE